MKKTEGISAGLFKATLQYLFGALESLRAPSSNALISFQAAVKSCAEQLGVKRPSESGDVVQRWSKVVRKTCANVSEARNPFENEGALVRTCQDLTQSSVVLIEDVVHVLAKRAISLGKEAKCIEILSKIRSYSNLNPPIVLQYSPETFVPNQTESSNGDGDIEHREPSEMMDVSEQGSTDEFTTAHTLDLSGLLVDWLELLDPETVSLCPESIQQIVFSSSHPVCCTTHLLCPSILLTSHLQPRLPTGEAHPRVVVGDSDQHHLCLAGHRPAEGAVCFNNYDAYDNLLVMFYVANNILI